MHGALDGARATRQWTTALKPHGSRTRAVGGRAHALPSRLAEALIEATGIDPRLPLANLSRADRLRLIDTLVRGALPWTGDEGYKKAEVTGGGVSLNEVDPRTMESRQAQAALPVRRDARRVRSDRRLQLPLGLGHGPGGRAGGICYN